MNVAAPQLKRELVRVAEERDILKNVAG